MNRQIIKKNRETKITVYDALCGTGKSVAAITDVNTTDDRVIVITPLEDEMNRYVKECARLTQPVGKYKGGGKTESSRDLIDQGLSFVTSHELAKRWTQADYKAITKKDYRLIMDESFDFIGPFNPCSETAKDLKELQECEGIPTSLKARLVEQLKRGMKPRDISAFVEKFCTVDQETGLLDLQVDENGNPVDSDTFAPLIKLVKEHRLVYDSGSLLKILPPEFLNAFKEVKILTYMFNKLPSASYMNIFDFRYSDGYITDKMTFTDSYCKRHVSTVDYESLIKIWDEAVDKNMVKLNAPGYGKYALSSRAYKEKMTKDDARQVFKHMHNWRMRYANLKTSQMFFISYSCSVDESDKNRCFYSSSSMREKYKKRHLACNIKATNKFGDCTGIAYLINRFSDVSMFNYCKNKGHPYSQDDFATSEMIQAIFRSALRKGEHINIFIPSSRMRSLLRKWIAEQTEFLKSLNLDENGTPVLEPFS